ncbi:gar2 protein [Spatholobus suberectus]|nr:gar2 protein [Spatholobus suberectus]
MEDKSTTITNRQGKKKIHPLISLSIGGEGGIAGLFVFGGALAIAGFMAVASFASNKHKAKGTHDHQPKPKPKPQQVLLDEHGCKSEEDHDTTQSLTSFIQHSTIQHGDATCCWTSNMSINQVSSSSELLSAESLILEEKSELKPRKVEESPTQQEIVFSDSSHPESAASSNEGGVAEECLVSLFNNSKAQEVEKDEEPQDDLTSSETETETEDDDIKDDDDDEEEEEDDDMMSDDVSQIGEENSSKATGTTSLDHNEEPVWPAELIQQAKQKFKGDSLVCTDSDVDGSDYDETKTVAKQAALNQNLNFFMVLNNQPLTWVFPLLLLALLLLLVLLTRRPQESFYVLDDGNSVGKRI